jgi:hypothetical protein
LPRYAAFAADCERHALRFTCEDCALYDPERDLCVHGFPTTEHRLGYYEDPGAPIVFCKDFELA